MRKIDPWPIDHGRAQASEAPPLRTDFERLVLLGINPPSPPELGDDELPTKLWEVINGLAELGRVLVHTDHLDDRELYERLWHDLLREEVPDADQPEEIQVVDLIGGWGPEDLRTFLRYYVDDDVRDDFADGLPPEEVPARESPPFDRDRRIALLFGLDPEEVVA